MIVHERLTNGLQIVIEPVERTDVVSVGFWFLTGSRDEKASEHGLSHFLEHMLFKGTERRTAFDIAAEIDRTGGILNAFTEKETVCYYGTVASRHSELLLDVLADICFHSTLPEADIEKEKTIILSEIASTEDDPEELESEHFLSLLWPDNPLGNRITGEEKDVEKVTRRVLSDFYGEIHVPGNCIVAVSGRVDPDAVLKTLERLTRGLSSLIPVRPRARPSTRKVNRFERSDFQQVQVHFCTELPAFEDVFEYYKFLVFSTLMGETIGSRLFQNIRERDGLCYSIGSGRTFFSDCGLWSVFANSLGTSLDAVLKAIDVELGALKSHPPSAAEIGYAQSHLVGAYALAQEDMEVRMKRILIQHLFSKRLLSIPDSIDLIERVSRDDILDLSAKWIRGDRFHLHVFGSPDLDESRTWDFGF